MIIGDIEQEDVWGKVTGKFDVITFADVLEHLRDPNQALTRAKDYLKEDGFIIISLPNVANWRVRLSLLLGKFNYTKTGILDESHLRFYNLETAKNLIGKHYKIEKFFPAATRMPKFLLFAFSRFFATQWVFQCKQNIIQQKL